MSTTMTSLAVSVDEYLNSSYEYDMEYVDGCLVEREMPTIPHSLLQRILLFWFARFEREMGFAALQEVRTQIIPRARYRIPDLMLCPTPLIAKKFCDLVPWVVIEILSPEDTMSRTRERFKDYAGLGVSHLVLLDPEEYISYRFHEGSFIQDRFLALKLPNGKSVEFDSEMLFAQAKQLELQISEPTTDPQV